MVLEHWQLGTLFLIVPSFQTKRFQQTSALCKCFRLYLLYTLPTLHISFSNFSPEAFETPNYGCSFNVMMYCRRFILWCLWFMNTQSRSSAASSYLYQHSSLRTSCIILFYIGPFVYTLAPFILHPFLSPAPLRRGYFILSALWTTLREIYRSLRQ